MMRDVLIVRAPGEPREDLEAMRDYVEESLRRGVLVLSDGMELEVLSLPEPGEARISPDGPEEPSAVPTGRGAEEKRAIQEKLKAYRRARGLGCFRAVAQAGEPEVTETMLRGMVTGTVAYPMSDWWAAGRALERASKLDTGEVSRDEP